MAIGLLKVGIPYIIAASKRILTTAFPPALNGHKSNAVLDRYIRAARLFEDSPLEGMF